MCVHTLQAYIEKLIKELVGLVSASNKDKIYINEQ